MAERTTLAFVDRTYMLTDGAGGSVVLDCNDGDNYALMLDAFLPRPAPQRQAVSDSPLVDGRSYRPGLGKLESVILPFSVQVIATDAEDRLEKVIDLLDAARNHNLHVVYAPADSGTLTFYDIIPAPEFNTDRFWSRALQDQDMAVLDFEVEASPGYGAKRSLTVQENLAPNASGEDWTGGALDDWTITIGGASAITEEAGTVLDGSASVKMVRNAGDCYFTTTGFVPIDPDDPYYLDACVYSASALTMTYSALCYDVDGNSTGAVEFSGDTRGGSAWDREVARLYRAGTVTTHYIPAASWPADTVKVKLQIELEDNGTVYVDCIMFANVAYVTGKSFDGVVGVCIPPSEDVAGDLPALCEITFSNPFTTPPYKTEESGVEVDLRGLSYLDATHAWAVGEDGTILYNDGFSWAPQASGVTKFLYGISAFDSTHAWAVGEDGTVLFSSDGGATWAAQTIPLVTFSITNSSFESWSGNNLLNWDEEESGMTIDPVTGYARTGSKNIGFNAVGGGSNVTAYMTNDAFHNIRLDRSYSLKVYQKYGTISGSGAYRRIYVLYYDSGGDLLDWDYYSCPIAGSSWTLRTLTVDPADYPEGTVKVKFRIRVGASYTNGDMTLDFDDISFTQTTKSHLYGVHAFSDSFVAAVGGGGSVFTTADGGATWTERTSGVVTTLRAVHGDNATRIIAVGDSGVILTSADGTTWTARVSGVATNLYGVYALDSTHAWAVGAGGVILFSGDAGATWSALSSGVGVDLYSVYAADSTHVWAVGAGGTLLFSADGSSWSVKAPGTPNALYSVDGISATSVLAVGGGGAMTGGVFSGGALVSSNIIIGQRDGYHAAFNPVVKTTDGDLGYSPYRYQGDYRKFDPTETADFIYNLLSHAGNYYAISAGLTFSGATAYDKGTIHKLLQTIEGTAITTQYQEDEIDVGDPNTDWIETLLLDATWDDTYLPSHVVSDDALLANIDQVVQLIAHTSLAAVDLYVDHLALVPIDRWVRVDEVTSNYIIVDSTMGVVFDSIDGGASTAMTHDPTDVVGTPRFQLDPAGTNMTIIAVNEVSGDMRLDLVNIEITYRPRTKLHL